MEWFMVATALIASTIYLGRRWIRNRRRLAKPDQASCCQVCGSDCPRDKSKGSDCTLALILLVLLAGGWPAGPASAADTIETWDSGATDVDFYLGMNGFGKSSVERSLSADIMLGYGLVDRFSAYLGTAMGADGKLQNGAPTIYLGVFGTPLDTDHLDLDLLLGFDLGGQSLDDFGVKPGIEIVFDAYPDMHTWGLYLRSFARFCSGYDETGAAVDELHLDLINTLGSYYSVAEGHQLFLELDCTYRPLHSQGQIRLEAGGIALGYNLTLNDSLELINQVFIDLPQAGQGVAVGITLGFIASLPAAG